MKRQIVAFHLDPENDCVADLDCGHGQHVRHNPPFENRAWTTSEEGRKSKLGVMLNCVRCEELELPQNLIPYKKTAVFDADSVPTALTLSHSTKAGVWAKIHVLEGGLSYSIAQPLGKTFVLDSAHAGIVIPEVAHSVQPVPLSVFTSSFTTKGRRSHACVLPSTGCLTFFQTLTSIVRIGLFVA